MCLPERLEALMKGLDAGNNRMPPTVLYNEGWMLRLILDAAERGQLGDLIPPGSKWYSEAQLRTPFGKSRGKACESNTHADGVIADFLPFESSKSGLVLASDAKRFEVFEAKMFSPLSSGTKNAPGFDQVARTIACMAHTLDLAKRSPNDLERVGFYVVAPERQIKSEGFAIPLTLKSIRARVAERIDQFHGHTRDVLLDWQSRPFNQLLDRLEPDKTLRAISWEALLHQLRENNSKDADDLQRFYDKCQQYGQTVTRSDETGTKPAWGRDYVPNSGKFKGQTVKVCSAGRQSSRVYRLGHPEDTVLVPSVDLVEVPEQMQSEPLIRPSASRTYRCMYKGEKRVVRVVSVGDWHSRVCLVDEPKTEFLPENHQLEPESGQ